MLVLEASVSQNQGKGPKVEESMNSHDVREFRAWIRMSLWFNWAGVKESLRTASRK